MEVVIVVAILITVSAIAVPGYTSMVEKARIAVAIGDLGKISSEISLFTLRTNALPDSLADVGLAGMMDPWGRPYVYLRIQGTKGREGQFRKDKNLHPLNSDYDLYSLGKDGMTSPPINAKISEDDIVRANNGGFVGLATNY